MALRDYLATEVALDHAEGHLSRRTALKRLGLLGLSSVAASGLLAACAEQKGPPPTQPAPAAANPGYDVAAAIARTSTVTFPGAAGTAGTITGAYAAPAGTPPGAVLVVHENKGLTDFIRAVTGRFAGDGYAALAPDLLSRVGGTAAAPDATAALGLINDADLVADLRSGLAELARRHPGVPLAAVGFCFGGGMVWELLDAGAGDLTVAVPFYGPVPDHPKFAGNHAAVLGIFAELDMWVNIGKARADAALTAAGLTHEFVTVPGVDHAFFNDTGPRFNEQAATQTYARVLAWFRSHLVTT
ncbi:MAG TPA: dienelactone hydrolase family protein [Pseudonocardia sp.]